MKEVLSLIVRKSFLVNKLREGMLKVGLLFIYFLWDNVYTK